MANAPVPQFQLNGTQMLALTLIEQQQAQLTIAANAIMERAECEADAAKLLHETAQLMEAAKLAWLHTTQRAIRVVSAIPDKLNGSNGAGLVQP